MHKTDTRLKLGKQPHTPSNQRSVKEKAPPSPLKRRESPGKEMALTQGKMRNTFAGGSGKKHKFVVQEED